MTKVYILFHSNSIIRVFKNYSDANAEEIYLSEEYPNHIYYVKEYEVE